MNDFRRPLARTLAALALLICAASSAPAAGEGSPGGTTPSPQGASQGSPVYVNVKSAPYNATGNGTTDDTAALTAALAAVTAAGKGTLYLPPGNYRTNTCGFAVSVPMTITGEGSSATPTSAGSVSRISCASATANLFNVTADSATIKDLYLVNTSPATPRAGAAVRVAGTSSSQKVDLLGVVADGFYINFDYQVGSHWTIHHSHSNSPVKYGLRVNNTVVPDVGDWAISDSTFFAVNRLADAAIRIEGGGGGKIVNVKINTYDDPAVPGVTGFTDGISVATAATSVLLIANNSIENIIRRGIDVTNYSLVTVTGNEFGFYISNSGPAVVMDGTAYSTIEGNTFRGPSSAGQPAIHLNNTSKVKVGDGNGYSGFGALLQITGTYSTGGAAATPVSLQNGWANLGSGLASAGYTFEGGLVCLQGTVAGGTPGSAIFTLQAGLRPSAKRLFPALANFLPNYLVIDADGTVKPSPGSSNAAQTLDGACFSPAP